MNSFMEATQHFLPKIAIVLMTIFSLSSNSLAANIDDLKECIGALHTLDDKISKMKPNLNSDYVKGLMGLLMFSQDLDQADSDSLRSVKGDISQIQTCIGITNLVTVEDIDILIKAYNGLLSNDPFDDIASCYVVFLHMTQVLDDRFNDKTAQSLGSLVGERFGTIGGILAKLYNEKEFSFEKLHSDGILKFQSLQKMKQQQINSTMSRYYGLCRWYDIPVEDVLNGAAKVIE